MFILRLLSRLVSLFVASINFFVACSWFSSFYDSSYIGGSSSKIGYYAILFVIQIVLVLPLLFVWFSDYFAGLEWGDQTWRIPHWNRQMSLFPCVPSLIKFTGWVFLLLPSLIFIWSKLTD